MTQARRYTPPVSHLSCCVLPSPTPPPSRRSQSERSPGGVGIAALPPRHQAGGPSSGRPRTRGASQNPPKTPRVAGVFSQQVLPCCPALRPALPGIPARFSRLFLVCKTGSQHAPLSVSLLTRYRLLYAQKVRVAQVSHLQELCWLGTVGYGEHHHGQLAFATSSEEDQAAGLQGSTVCSKSFVFILGA